MRIHLIAVGTRMPGWVQEGFAEYTRRMPRECRLELAEIAPGHRGRGGDAQRAMAEEGKRMQAAIPRQSHVIALDERGAPWTTRDLSAQLDRWMQQTPVVSLLVGGPDGLAAECRELARQSWSLSPLTLPHALVRVLVAEQIYRAWSVLAGYPYHRD